MTSTAKETKAPANVIAAAMVAIQQEVGAVVAKDAKNPFFKNEYATLEAVLLMLRPALDRHSLAIYQEASTSEGKVSVRTTLIHTSGAALVFEPCILPAEQTAQGYGSAITYARRYSLMALFGLAPTDDDGNAASGRKGKAAKPEPAPSDEEIVAQIDACASLDSLQDLYRLLGPQARAYRDEFTRRKGEIAA